MWKLVKAQSCKLHARTSFPTGRSRHKQGRSRLFSCCTETRSTTGIATGNHHDRVVYDAWCYLLSGRRSRQTHKRSCMFVDAVWVVNNLRLEKAWLANHPRIASCPQSETIKRTLPGVHVSIQQKHIEMGHFTHRSPSTRIYLVTAQMHIPGRNLL